VFLLSFLLDLWILKDILVPFARELHVKLGMYYLETFSLFVLVCYLACMHYRGSRRWRDKVTLGLGAAFIVVIFAAIVWNCQGQFHYELQRPATRLIWMNITRDIPYEHFSLDSNATYMWKYDFHRAISVNRDVHGLFGIGLGMISVYVFAVGASYRLQWMDKELEDLPRTLMTSVSLMSVVVAVLTFALQKEQYYELIGHIFPVSIVLVGVFFLSLGLLVTHLRHRYGSRHEIVVITTFLGLAISFVIGFMWGDVAVPFSRTPMRKFIEPTRALAVLDPKGQAVFNISPGSYFFMAMLLVGLAVYVRILLLDRGARDAICQLLDDET